MSDWAVSVTGFHLLREPGSCYSTVAAAARPVTAAQALAAGMRSTPGRIAVFASWLWLGVHVLAR